MPKVLKSRQLAKDMPLVISKDMLSYMLGSITELSSNAALDAVEKQTIRTLGQVEWRFAEQSIILYVRNGQVGLLREMLNQYAGFEKEVMNGKAKANRE